MGQPSRIGIATRGYRTGSGNPGRICIATFGYRCPEEAPAVDRRDGDGGTGIRGVILDPQPTVKKGVDPRKIVAALVAIQDYYDGY